MSLKLQKVSFKKYNNKVENCADFVKVRVVQKFVCRGKIGYDLLDCLSEFGVINKKTKRTSVWQWSINLCVNIGD